MDPKKKDDLALNVANGTKELIKALEVGMYGDAPKNDIRDLKNLLYKLGIKSAADGWSLKYEGLDAMLKQVTFDIKQLKLWKTIKDDKN